MRKLLVGTGAMVSAVLAACAVGPNYHRPVTPVPPQFVNVGQPRFNGADVLDVMRTHPAAIIGDVLQHNPFYIPPEQMLKELRERGEIGDEREL